MFFLVSSEDADAKGREPPPGGARNGATGTHCGPAGTRDRTSGRDSDTDGSHRDSEVTGTTQSGVGPGREELLE